MIQQTYYPFSGQDVVIPFYSTPTFSDPVPSLDRPVHREDSNWFSWVLLIMVLIGLGGIVYWWRERNT